MEKLTFDQAQIDGTSVRRFLARRGVIFVKESRDIGTAQGTWHDPLLISTMVVAAIQGTNREISYGIRLEHKATVGGRLTTAVFLDFDEIAEVIDAFKFIISTAKQLGAQARDYTEVTYATKDDARFGFYVNASEQHYFVQLQPHAEAATFEMQQFINVARFLHEGCDHLKSRGATVV